MNIKTLEMLAQLKLYFIEENNLLKKTNRQIASTTSGATTTRVQHGNLINEPEIDIMDIFDSILEKDFVSALEEG